MTETIAAPQPPVPPPYPVYQPPPQSGFSRFMQRIVERPAFLLPAAALTCAAGAAWYVTSHDPTDGRPDFGGGCVVRMLTGFDCPGCGGTRALWYLLHGNLPQAARHHAVAVFVAPFIVYLYVAWAANRIFHTRLPIPRISPKAVAWW